MAVISQSSHVCLWCSGNGVWCINEVALRWTRLVPGWMTVSDGQTTALCNQPPRPTQPPTLSGMGSEYWLNCGDALRVSSKGRMAHFMWINVWVVGKTVWSLVNMCQSERFRDEYRTHYKALYKCSGYCTLLYVVDRWQFLLGVDQFGLLYYMSLVSQLNWCCSVTFSHSCSFSIIVC